MRGATLAYLSAVFWLAWVALRGQMEGIVVVDGGRGAAMMEPKGANDSRVRAVVDISISVEGKDGGMLVCIDQ